jgi:CxxC-x17-CxxC domain-containing protein
MTRTPTKITKRGGHLMSFQDKSLQCSDCGTTFTFSAEEQGQFASKGHTNNPKRCSSCRQERKARQNASSGNNFRNDSYGNRPQREMFSAVCAECRKTTRVPFKPSEDRPVYCSDCYNKVRLSRSH